MKKGMQMCHAHVLALHQECKYCTLKTCRKKQKDNLEKGGGGQKGGKGDEKRINMWYAHVHTSYKERKYYVLCTCTNKPEQSMKA